MSNDPGIGLAREAGAVGVRCPSNEALARWIDQGLGITDRAAIRGHLRRCPPCRLVVLQVLEMHLSGGSDPDVPSWTDPVRGTPWSEMARRAWSNVRRRFTTLATASVAAVQFRV
jgi:hypothetical protein